MNTLHAQFPRTTRRLRQLALPLALAALPGAALADDSNKIFTVGGFGTLGVNTSSFDNGDFAVNPFQPTGAGTKKQWSATTDTLAAMQVDAKIDEHWSGVLQVVSSMTAENSFEPHIEWANIKYAFTPDLSVRVGRIALPSFLVSDTRLVGYANTWARAPQETYSLYGLTNSDGIDGKWSQSFGGFRNTVQAWFGRAKGIKAPSAGGTTTEFSMRKMRGISDTVEKGALTIRASAHISQLVFELPASYGSDLLIGYKNYSLGAIYDPGTWFVQGEVALLKRWISAPLFGMPPGSERAFNAIGGYRYNAFTPYLAYSRVGNSTMAASRAQRTTAAGVRWDFYKNMDLKLQLEHVALGAKSAGFFVNAKPGLAGSSGNIATLALDFIY
ncbi:hypothetical protein [Massilia sp. S19_KUP03_FR1]|uniref:hypothetical protein n=1 Tax=Massilia sp. S19_KUP03_FR1 TaxID=3025503 RepID=UPI002FCD48C8